MVVGVPPLDVVQIGKRSGQLFVDIRHRNEFSPGDPAKKVAAIETAQAAQPDHSNIELTIHVRFSFLVSRFSFLVSRFSIPGKTTYLQRRTRNVKQETRNAFFSPGYQLNLDRDIFLDLLSLQQAERVFNRTRSHLIRRLSYRRIHSSLLNRLPRFRKRIEADDRYGPGLLRGGYRFDCSQRHQIAACKQGLNIGMRLKNILKDVVALIPLPIGRLRCDDLNFGVARQRAVKSLQPGVARLVTRNAFEDCDLSLAAEPLDDELASKLAALEVVGPDEPGDLPAGLLQRL